MRPDLTSGELVTFGLLTLALAALWLPGRRRGLGSLEPWLVLLALAAGAGAYFGFLRAGGILALVALRLATLVHVADDSLAPARFVAGAVVLALAAGCLLHRLPGFANPEVLSDVVLKPGAVAYSKYLNFDKAALGVLLLAAYGERIASRREALRVTRLVAPIVALTTGAALFPALVLGYVELRPGVPSVFLLWAWTNLFFTCVAEEALFRGLIQRSLERWLDGWRRGALISLMVASVIFGLAHLAGGWTYVALAALAGLGYGWAFQRTGRVEAAILTHFAVNLVHFLLFTYPAAA